MTFRAEVIPFIVASLAAGGVAFAVAAIRGHAGATSAAVGAGVGTILSLYMLYFFRDPPRTPPRDAAAVVAAADGVVAKITELKETQYLNAEAVRISIFLSLFDVHVNRAPMSGKSKFLGYFPGRRYFTFTEKSSEFNQHNSILITGQGGERCLVHQIVGPVCRRVVYWLDHEREVDVAAGDRFGMMKFGSRLDMVLPKADVDVVAKQGDKVRAGETVVARLRGR